LNPANCRYFAGPLKQDDGTCKPHLGMQNKSAYPKTFYCFLSTFISLINSLPPVIARTFMLIPNVSGLVHYFFSNKFMLFNDLFRFFKLSVTKVPGKPLVFTILLLGHFIAQGQISEKTLINGSFNQSCNDFFREIGKKYDIHFYYKPEWFKDRSIRQTYENVTLEKVLGDMLDETPYTFLQMPPNFVVFLPKEEVQSVINHSSFESPENTNVQIIGKKEDAGKVKRPEIKGTITDGRNGDPIIGAIVAVQNGNYGTTSDGDGKFSLGLSPGEYTLIFSSIGYEQKTFSIRLIGNGELNIELFDASVKLDEVVVSAQRNDRNVNGNQISMVELDRKSIRQIPPLFGEKDVIKGLTTLPGVKSVGEFGAGINVRGGSSDQNLFLLEGSPVFNTAHVFGLLSVINPDAVSNVSLYKGYIPPSYGERISSVMDIQLKEGNMTKFHSSGGIGLLNSRLMLESPLAKNKASFVIGGRTSYSDWLLRKMPDIDLRNSSAGFSDVFATISLITGPKDKMGLFGYASKDRFQYSNEIIYNYENYLVSYYWDHQYNSQLSSKLILSHSRYQIAKDAIESEFEKSRISTSIGYSNLKMDFSYRPVVSHTINLGMQIIYYQLNPGIQQPLDANSGIQNKSLQQEQGIESAIFAGDSYTLGDRFNIQAGVRLSGFALLGPNSINIYQPGGELSPNTVIGSKYYSSGQIISRYIVVEPRAATKILLGETRSIKISYNHNAQYLNLISYTAVSTPDDVWKLCSPYLRPATCDQYAAGYFQNFDHNRIEASVEIYYKKLNHLVEYKNGAQISMNGMLETDLIDARGTNYGIEMLLKKNSGVFDGWISYTYSKSLKQTTGNISSEMINSNRVYPSPYDKPHDLTLVGTYHYNKRLRMTCSYNFSSGRAVTLPEVRFMIGDKEYVNFSDRNKYRLPYYQRVDLSISYDESLYLKRKWKGSWTFSIINILGRNNAYSVIYKESEHSAENKYSGFGLYKLYIIGQPLPTLTYNFIF
jgi:hypothetical protein